MCDTDFFNFHHCQVWDFKISNLFERNRNSTKYFATSRKLSVIPLKFHEMSLVLWNLINYCKISQFIIKFGKSSKDFRKILLKWLGKTVKYWLNFVNSRSCTEKCLTTFIHNLNKSSQYWTKVFLVLNFQF